ASVKILDMQGNTVPAVRGTRKGGLKRVWWHLRTVTSKEVRLRATPLYATAHTFNAVGRLQLQRGGPSPVLVQHTHITENMTPEYPPSAMGSTRLSPWPSSTSTA